MSHISILELEKDETIQPLDSDTLNAVRGGEASCKPQTITKSPDGTVTIECKDGRVIVEKPSS
jgi:hypothetical protein